MLPKSETDTLSGWYLLGSRNYELSDHLGNVTSEAEKLINEQMSTNGDFKIK